MQCMDYTINTLIRTYMYVRMYEPVHTYVSVYVYTYICNLCYVCMLGTYVTCLGMQRRMSVHVKNYAVHGLYNKYTHTYVHINLCIHMY